MEIKTQQLLLKIRKGATASITPGQMIKHGVFEAAGLHAQIQKFGRPEFRVEGGWVLQVSDVSQSDFDPKIGAYKQVAAPGSYKSFKVYWNSNTGYRAKEAKEPDVYSPYDLWKWLKENFDFTTRVNQALGMEAHVPASRRSKDGTGTCPCCFRNIKIHDHVSQVSNQKRMVNHGYTQEYGRGAHRGDQCPASKRFQPYELSADGTRWMKHRYDTMVNVEEVDLQTIKAALDTKKEIYIDGKTKVPDAYDVRRAEYELKAVQGMQEFYGKMVDTWQKRDLPKEGDLLLPYVKD